MMPSCGLLLCSGHVVLLINEPILGNTGGLLAVLYSLVSNRSRGSLCEDGLVEGAASVHESSVKEAEGKIFQQLVL